jgi:hypothetical protein
MMMESPINEWLAHCENVNQLSATLSEVGWQNALDALIACAGVLVDAALAADYTIEDLKFAYYERFGEHVDMV